MTIQEEICLRVGEERVLFAPQRSSQTERWACLSAEDTQFSLTAWEKECSVEPSPEELCGAGQVLWQMGHRENPVPMFCGGEPRLLLCSTLQNRVSAVTAEVGRADFMPRNIPLRFETPLMNDPVTLPGATVPLTALRFGVPYAVVFAETAGDCLLFSRAEEISRLYIFPQGAEVVFAYMQGETTLHLRPYHRDGTATLRGRDICAALAAAVAVGKCLPQRTVSVPLAEGEARAVCTKDWNLFLTLPIFGDFA